MKWRRSYDVAPPAMTEDHPHYNTINNDIRYRQYFITEGEDHHAVPRTESLRDCQQRVVAAWNDIVQDIVKAAKDKNDDDDTATATTTTTT